MTVRKNDVIHSSNPKSGWKRLVRWLSTLQNLEFEIDAVRIEIAAIEKNGQEVANKQPVINECRELLSKIEDAYNRTFPRELFIWETLFLIHQKILLVAPIEELSAKWSVLKKRLKQLEEIQKKTVYGWSNEVASDIDKWTKEKNEDNLQLRYQIKELRKSLDDHVILQVWTGMRLRRHSVFFVVAASILTAILIVGICWPLVFCSADCANKDRPPSALLMSVAGLLGAMVSTLTDGKPPGVTQHPPLVNVSMVRPLIGAIAGLFIYFVHPLIRIDFNYFVLLAVAIAFGFSERAFYKFLKKLAGDTEKNIGQVIN